MYIMSKARSMYAGSSGSNYGVNKNSPGNGNGKWQGLWPSVGNARNARHINIEAGGNNRNVVFCMNQLGGVGRISNMFATTADGVKDCKHGSSGSGGGSGGAGGSGNGLSLLAGSSSSPLPLGPTGIYKGFMKTWADAQGTLYPSFGTLTLEDKSPIKREDILALVQLSQKSGGDGKSFVVILRRTEDINNWLVKKQDDHGNNGNGIASFILNIDGKAIPNTGIITSQTEFLLTFGLNPTEQDTLIMQAGQTYNINFS